MMPNIKRIWPLLGITLFLLAACGTRIDQTATFYDDQSWDAEIVITIPRELAAIAGATSDFDNEIANEIQDMERAGVEVSYESRTEDGALKYFIEAQGDSLDSLQNIAFGGADIGTRRVNGQQQIEFAMNVPADLVGSSITLMGKEIVSSNGRVVEKGKVEWINPRGRVEAVIVPKSRFGFSALLGPLGIGAGVLAMAGVGLYLFRRRRSQVQVQATHSGFCSHCGVSLSPTARFCGNCGQPNYQ